jgi:hypothetical protein
MITSMPGKLLLKQCTLKENKVKLMHSHKLMLKEMMCQM